MSVAKIIELSARSPESFEHAIEVGIKRATRTIDNIQGIWVKEMNAEIEDGAVSNYRVDMKVTFVLEA